MNKSEGNLLLKLAKDSITSALSGKRFEADESIKNKFSKKQGAFVTLNKHGELRGCIGFPEPIYPLYYAVVEAARAAAFSDPRFPRLQASELPEIKIEVSVLTVPELIKVAKYDYYLKKIKIGRDGLIIRNGNNSGLLLPQVATEQKMNPETFLKCLCQKAGLPQSSWKDKECKIYSFQAEIFSE